MLGLVNQDLIALEANASSRVSRSSITAKLSRRIQREQHVGAVSLLAGYLLQRPQITGEQGCAKE